MGGVMENLADIAQRAFAASCPEMAVVAFTAESRDFGDLGPGAAIAMRVMIDGAEVGHQTLVRFAKPDDAERMAELCGLRLADWARIRARKSAA